LLHAELDTITASKLNRLPKYDSAASFILAKKEKIEAKIGPISKKTQAPSNLWLLPQAARKLWLKIFAL
jgi:hypothetical protein